MDQTRTIDDLISADQFNISQFDKEEVLIPILKEQIGHAIEHSKNIASFYATYDVDVDGMGSLADIPPIPVSMFKQFDLKTCGDEEIVRVLESSATTTGIPSRIYVDKVTAFRQTKALISTLKNFIGKSRKPFLVIDTQSVDKGGAESISARGAAIRGVRNFAKKTVYIMDDNEEELTLNLDRLDDFCSDNKDQEILVYGFTYIIWSRFVATMKELGRSLDFPDMNLLHSGGWKKLASLQVDKKVFNGQVAKLFNSDPSNVIDFYGMVEQVGVVFLDCEKGYKHVPDFADVIIRDPFTMEPLDPGKPGLIEILSILPNSYPGQALLTEDIGELIGVDDCPCGRKGKYFVFRSRVEKAELRGCGDTFAERRDEL